MTGGIIIMIIVQSVPGIRIRIKPPLSAGRREQALRIIALPITNGITNWYFLLMKRKSA